MFRAPQAGDWAADEDEDLGIEAPAPVAPPKSPWAEVEPAPAPAPAPKSPRSSRGEAPAATAAPARGATGSRWERFRQEQAAQQSSGRGDPRDRDYPPLGRDYRDTRDHRDYPPLGGGGGRDHRDHRDSRGDYRDSRGGGFRDRQSAAPPPPPMPIERGVVISLKENFGFVSCVEREGDLFFHISEAPVDVDLHDEVEFRVKYNQRSQKDVAVQLVRLPKGSIVWEDVTEDYAEGTVTKGIPRTSSYNSHGSSSRDEPHGLIEVRQPEDDVSAPAEAAEQSDDGATGETPGTAPSIKRREVVRYNAESVESLEGAEVTAGDGEKKHKRAPKIPHFGDDVRFRIATHRKTGQRRAVGLTITQSAKAKLEKEIDSKLATMTRELGVVDRIKSGGGFIRCCARTEDVYFPFHEIRASIDADGESDKKEKLQLRERDEVSFFVYEEKDDENPRSRGGRLTALRVVKLPSGSVSFEEPVRSDVSGTVTKTPKEPRNGPEVMGVINPTDADVITDESAMPAQVESSAGKKLKKKPAGVSFRLGDAADASYQPAVGDVVMFDQVLDKRSNRVKATNVRVVQLNAKNRETGVITTVKDDFGFIKCAERFSDAYFRFSDVMSVNNDFRVGTEVAFDVAGETGGKGDNVRATRVQILPHGSVKWETVVEVDAEADVISVPSRQAMHKAKDGAKGGKSHQFKTFNGRVRVALPNGKHCIDYFKSLREQIDAVFIAKQDDSQTKQELRVDFPSTLTKFERAAIHSYCDWLGIKHESSGDGPNRRLLVTAEKQIDLSTLDQSAQVTDIDFHPEDVDDVRYNPRVGDHVKLNVAISNRSKQLVAKHIVLLTAAAPKAAAKASKETTKSDLPKGEGFIVTIKPEGFGFIEPSDQALTGSENLFFHVKEIVSGEMQADLKEGMEVQYHLNYDDKRKKHRASVISIVPSGTVKRVDAPLMRGVVASASILHRFKGNARFVKNDKNKQQMSSVGRIRVALDSTPVETPDNGDGGHNEADKADNSVDVTEGTTIKSEPNAGKAKAKAPSKKSNYAYYVNDIVDQTIVLREGDEVEFLPISTAKGMRASKIHLIKSHARQGVVVRVLDDLSGVIRVDGDEALEVSFAARQVLRGDLLKEGDRVEFAVRQKPTESANKKAKAKKSSDEGDADNEANENDDEEEKEESAEAPTLETDAPTLAFIATSVLCLEPGADKRVAEQVRPENRSVNSSLLQAMRQVGASAVVKSRMAKGPDGTRGFKEGWRTDAATTTA